MTIKSRKKLAFIMLVCGALLSRTQAGTICSCYDDHRSNAIHPLGSRTCDVCSPDGLPVVDQVSNDRCDSLHSESIRQEHEDCGGPYARMSHVRCYLRGGVYTCRIPRRMDSCAIPFYGSLLLKYRTTRSSRSQSSTPEVLVNNELVPTVTLGNDCSKLTICIHQNNGNDTMTLAFSITGSDEMIVNDVIVTVSYTCPPGSTGSAGLLPVIRTHRPISTSSSNVWERFLSG